MNTWKRIGCAVLAGVLMTGSILAAASQLKDDEVVTVQGAAQTELSFDGETSKTQTMQIGSQLLLQKTWTITEEITEPTEPTEPSKPEQPSEPSAGEDTEDTGSTEDTGDTGESGSEQTAGTKSTQSTEKTETAQSAETAVQSEKSDTQETTREEDIVWSLSNTSTDDDGNTIEAAKLEQNSDGQYVVTALREGTATVSATISDGTQLTCEITVAGYAVAEVKLSADKTALMEGDTVQINAEILPEQANGNALHWYSSNTAVATVDENGKVTAVAAGDVTIGAQADNEVSGTIDLHIDYKLTGIKMEQETASTQVPFPIQLKVTPVPEQAALPTIKWSSADEKVATVNDNGVVTPKQAGKVRITAQAGSFFAECLVTVTKAELEDVQLNTDSLVLAVRNTDKLTQVTEPKNINKRITWKWSSSNAAVVSVDQNGNIRANKEGTAYITVEAVAIDGKELPVFENEKQNKYRKATCRVSVRNNLFPNVSGNGTNGNIGYRNGVWGNFPSLGGLPSINGLGASTGASVRQYTMPTYIPTAAFLTVDADFASGQTSQIVNTFKLYGMRGTFFISTEDLQAADDQVREIVANGNSIGILLTAEQARSADVLSILEDANEHLSVITGTPTRLVRIAGGQTGLVTTADLQPMRTAGYRVWEWNTNANEATQTADSCYQAVSRALNATGTVTVRFGDNESAVSALQLLLPYAKYCALPCKPITSGDTPICGA